MQLLHRLEVLFPKGIAQSWKKLQVGTGIGGLEKELEGKQKVLRKKS